MNPIKSREPCPQCRKQGSDQSGDNLCVYHDGHVHCFACGYHKGGQRLTVKKAGTFRPYEGSYQPIPDRKITEASCKKYGVTIGPEGQHYYPYYKDGELVAQHIRSNGKKFAWKNSLDGVKSLNLFGQHLWKPGKRVIITEGEIDCLSISQVMDHKWPVVSVPNGAKTAPDSIRSNLEWLSQFQQIILCFDMDEAGKKAAKECAELLPVGKTFILELPAKDANEMLLAGKGADLISCSWNNIREYRPDGIIAGPDVDLQADQSLTNIWEWPWPSMTAKMYGRRPYELITIAAGSGVGKSTFVRELIYDDLLKGDTVGVMMLEESTADTLRDLIGLHINKPLRKIMVSRVINESRKAKGMEPIDFGVVDDVTEEEVDKARREITKSLYLYDHFGSVQKDNLLRKLEYMVKGLGCTKVYIDHISIVVSGLETDNERKDIDVLMTELRSFVQRTGVNLVVVSHLRKSSGKPYEEGGRVTAQDLRGSGSILQLSNVLLALERDQQAENRDGTARTTLRCLKDRLGSFTGVVTDLLYEQPTGRLKEVAHLDAVTGVF